MSRSKDRTAPALTGCTCLRLRMAARRLTQIYDRALESHGLTVTQFSLLGHVRAYDGIGMAALADRLLTDPTTLTRNLRPLERRKLLVMGRDPTDRRSRSLHLTDKGREAYTAAKPAWAEAQREIERLLGGKGATALNATLDHVLERLAN